MFENIFKFFKKAKKEDNKITDSKSAAKERLQLVLMQDRANVSADFLDLMRHEIIEVIKKYIDVDEKSIDVRLTNIENEDGTNGAPALYANIPILNIKNEARKVDSSKIKEYKEEKKEENKEEIKEEVKQENPQPQENPENKKEEKEEKEEK
ncbi:MAG: cell division topological specificity factor MinE, partial [Clostridia bacterium]|nr:cell division topological specificity factor MinE [Clostridia bacterium]